MYTFEQWRATAKQVPDLGAETGNDLDAGTPGVIYRDPDGCPIGQIEILRPAGRSWLNEHDCVYRVHAEASEIETPDRLEAEKWLWINWSSHQIADVNDDLYALAREFGEAIRTFVGEDIDEIIRLNREETDPNICHSHDFCDANEVMAESFEHVFGRELDIRSDEADLVTAAWDEAKLRGFRS